MPASRVTRVLVTLLERYRPRTGRLLHAHTLNQLGRHAPCLTSARCNRVTIECRYGITTAVARKLDAITDTHGQTLKEIFLGR